MRVALQGECSDARLAATARLAGAAAATATTTATAAAAGRADGCSLAAASAGGAGAAVATAGESIGGVHGRVLVGFGKGYGGLLRGAIVDIAPYRALEPRG